MEHVRTEQRSATPVRDDRIKRVFGLGKCALAVLSLAAIAMLSGCGGGDSGTPLVTCDDSMKATFTPDANTTVLLANSFKQGDPLLLSGTPGANTLTAAAD